MKLTSRRPSAAASIGLFQNCWFTAIVFQSRVVSFSWWAMQSNSNFYPVFFVKFELKQKQGSLPLWVHATWPSYYRRLPIVYKFTLVHSMFHIFHAGTVRSLLDCKINDLDEILADHIETITQNTARRFCFWIFNEHTRY